LAIRSPFSRPVMARSYKRANDAWQ
jgi:hypothetical protein